MKVLEKDVWSGQEKTPTWDGCPAGLTGDLVVTSGCGLCPAPWPCKRLIPLSDHQTKTVLQNNNPLTAHSQLLLRAFFCCYSSEAEIKGILPRVSWKDKCWKIQFYFHLLVGKKTTMQSSEKAAQSSNIQFTLTPCPVKTFVLWTPTACNRTVSE